MSTYATDLVLDEALDIISGVVGDLEMPAQEGDARPPTLLVGVSETSTSEIQAPFVVVNIDRGRSGTFKNGEDRRGVLRVTVVVYLSDADDYIWVARLCELILTALLSWDRVALSVQTIDGRDVAVRWESVDTVEFPLGGAALTCEFRMPSPSEVAVS